MTCGMKKQMLSSGMACLLLLAGCGGGESDPPNLTGDQAVVYAKQETCTGHEDSRACVWGFVLGVERVQTLWRSKGEKPARLSEEAMKEAQAWVVSEGELSEDEAGSDDFLLGFWDGATFLLASDERWRDAGE